MIGMEDRTVAKHLLDQLTEWGCERIYGVIGDANLELLDELAKQDRIRYIACRHETAAALMASAEAKLTGKLAVCMATSGPGIALLINGLADAYFDRAPVLAVTGQVATKNMGTGSHQEIDQQRLVQPVVQYSATTVNPEAFPTQLNLAAKTALARGTVAHLSIPKDLWKQTVRSRLFPLPPPDPSVIAYQEEYQTVLKLLEQAGRPVLLAGRGIRNVREEVVRLAEKLTAPIITTMPAKSCVPNDHPLFVGGLGQGGSEASTQLLHEADLCLILGATWWPEDYVPQDLPVIQVDSVSENIGRTHVPKAALVENLGSLLPELVNDVSTNSNPEWEQTIQEKKAAWDLKVAGEIQQIQSPLAPQRVLYAINQQVDPDAVISVDTGDHTLWFERVFHFAEQEILLSGKWRTLGFALPAAIAAKLCAPGRQSVAIAGDGGILQTIAELNTAVNQQLALTVFVLKNQAYAMERNKMLAEGLETLGAELAHIDLSTVAVGLGAKAYRVETEAELEPVIQQALSEPCVTLVEIVCEAKTVPHTKIGK
ncbi:thiamine pyrophosphate-binding protein [Thermoactinomyces vulgaris]|jgi:pyruvate oxidase|nr:thiamine pyrophosphate-binding protein [Thermoactinomyces vulgaris]